MLTHSRRCRQRPAAAVCDAFQSGRARQAEFAAIARLLGEDTPRAVSVEQAAERAIVAVERLKAEIGIPARLRDLGITEAQIPVWLKDLGDQSTASICARSARRISSKSSARPLRAVPNLA